MHNVSLNWLDDVAKENDLHHRKPTAMLQSSGWTNMKSAAVVGWPVAASLWWFGCPMWVWLVPFFAAFGNLVHRFAHTPRRQLPRYIQLLQDVGLFISYDHHDAHHRSMAQLIPKHIAGYKFCPMTNWMNPLLDGIQFWAGVETCLAWIGIKTTKARMEANGQD